MLPGHTARWPQQGASHAPPLPAGRLCQGGDCVLIHCLRQSTHLVLSPPPPPNYSFPSSLSLAIGGSACSPGGQVSAAERRLSLQLQLLWQPTLVRSRAAAVQEGVESEPQAVPHYKPNCKPCSFQESHCTMKAYNYLYTGTYCVHTHLQYMSQYGN